MAKKRVFYTIQMMFNFHPENEHMKECTVENNRDGTLKAQTDFAYSIEAAHQKRMAMNMI